MSHLKRTSAIVLALFLTLSLMPLETARADASSDTSINNAATWIADRWENNRGQFFAAGTVADGVIALSAANQKPDTVRQMLIDLKEEGPAYAKEYPAGLAKIIMTADMAGQNPRTFFGCERDLVAELRVMTAKRPTTTREYWGPYLIAIALSRSGEQVPAWIMQDLEKSQQSGGFGYTRNDGSFRADPDYTALGISAMDRISRNPKNQAERQRAQASIDSAVSWSADAAHQKTDGAGNIYWETYSSNNSTGMMAGALSEVGVEVDSPVRYLTSQQNTDGGWGASHGSKRSDVMATTQAILGVVGEGYSTIRSTQVPELVKCGTTPPVKPTYPKTVYNTPGYQTVNGRQWYTTCEKYSQTTRCTANIKATKVASVGGRFVATTDYVFNNLTYLPAPTSLWRGNPLGNPTEWTATNGRKWKTECNTPVTGNGCRSYIWANVIENVAKPGQPIRYAWVWKWEFNNMVQYS